MTIRFKNGEELNISNEVAETIKNRLLEGCQQWQIFSNEKDEVLLILNTSEIVYVA